MVKTKELSQKKTEIISLCQKGNEYKISKTLNTGRDTTESIVVHDSAAKMPGHGRKHKIFLLQELAILTM